MAPFDSAWAQWGAWGIVAIFVMLVAVGRLVPRSSARTLVDQANRSADLAWQAATAADKRADLFGTQLGEMLAAMRAVEMLVRNHPPWKDGT
jgi:hypothetical protein